MKNNHQNMCKNKNRKNIDYVEDHPMNIPTYWPSEVNGQRRLRRLV